MTDEEKQAIEKLDYELTYSWVHNQGISKETLKSFKDIIEKQQKEIEKINIELEQRKIVDKNSMSNQDNFYDCYNYISKDKIREIISKYVDIEEHLVYHHEELWGVDLAEMIKELLGE